MIRLFGALAGALLVTAAPIAVVRAQAQGETIVELPSAPLTIGTGRKAHRFQVELARSGAEQERGLMYRRHMAATHGMIFPMEPPRPASFWMKNTYLPLDIIFIGPDHRILRIAPRATPLSTATIDCPEPAAAVLELNGGIAERLHIREGDKVVW